MTKQAIQAELTRLHEQGLSPAYRAASRRTGKTISTHATLAEATAAVAAIHRAGGWAFVDRMGEVAA